MARYVDLAVKALVGVLVVTGASLSNFGLLPLALFGMACVYFRMIEDSTSVEEELEFWRIVSD